MILLWIWVGQKRKLGANPVAAVDGDSHQPGEPVLFALQIFPDAMEQRSRSMVKDGQGLSQGTGSSCQNAKEMNEPPRKPLLPQKDRAAFGTKNVTLSGNRQLNHFANILLVWQKKIGQFPMQTMTFLTG